MACRGVIILCVLTFAALVTSHPRKPESKVDKVTQKIWDMAKICSVEANIPFDYVRDYSAAVVAGQKEAIPENLGCYLKCMFIYDGAMTETGKIIVPEKFPMKEAMDACVEKIPDSIEDLCDRAIEAHKCHLENMPMPENKPKPMKLDQEKKLFFNQNVF